MIHFIKINPLYYLLGIVIFAACLRFWGLTSVPPSLYWDEVSQGFNAYLILETGKDEHQEFLPLARFKAFGDYKAPVYTYAIVPFMQLFGKSDLSIRLPSAFFGTLTVLLTYLLSLQLFERHKSKYLIGLLAAFLLAISPWHIQLSRAAYEGNIATFFTVMGVWLFYRGKDRKSISLVLSVVSFVFAFYAFNAHRVFIPLFVIFLGIVYFKNLLQMKRTLVLAGFVGIILMIPFAQYFLTPESRLRFNEVNIFSDIDIIEQSNEWTEYSGNSLLSKIVDNRRVLYASAYLENYFDFFNPNYLFFTGDENPRFSLQSNGILYLWELPFLLIGFYLLLKNRTKEGVVILGWFFLAPIVGATARETPHALRSETFIPTYQIISAIGISTAVLYIRSLKHKELSIIACGIFVTVIAWSTYVFMHNYFVHFPVTYSGVWQYGYPQAVKKAIDLAPQYEHVLFTTSFGRPYVYVAFYGNYSPETYWSESRVVRDQFGFYEVPRLGKFEFRQITEDDEIDENTLYVGSISEIDERFTILDTVETLDGKTSFVIAEKAS